MTCLGETCVDVYLNERRLLALRAPRVWTYTIGGYQVIKKWLSYRERPLLGRDLTVDEARYVMEMARRIAAILLLEPALDANYEMVKADTYAGRQAGAEEEVVDEPGPSLSSAPEGAEPPSTGGIAMGMRFRRSIKLGPGVRFNLSKTGVGISAGLKGARYSVHSSGRKTTAARLLAPASTT